MMKGVSLSLTLLFAVSLLAAPFPVLAEPEPLGHFLPGRDLWLPQFDSKTDVDDLHSVAAVATLVRDPRFADVDYHAVAGAYGIQEGLYVPSPELFEKSFVENDTRTGLPDPKAEWIAEGWGGASVCGGKLCVGLAKIAGSASTANLITPAIKATEMKWNQLHFLS